MIKKTRLVRTHVWSRGKNNPFVSAVFQLSSCAIDKRASNIDLFRVTRCFALQSKSGSGDWVYCNSVEDRTTGTVHTPNVSSRSAYSQGEMQTVYVQECLLNWHSWTNPLNVPNIHRFSINNCFEFEAVSQNERQIFPSLWRRSDASRPKNPFLHLQSDNWHTLFAS